MKLLLAILSVLAALAGGSTLTKATLGVGLIASACLLAIFARIAQAHGHHAAIMNELKSRASVEHDDIRVPHSKP